MMMRWRSAMAIALLVTSACRGKDNEPTPETKAAIDQPPKRTPLTFAQLAPIVHEVGTTGGLPTHVVVELAAPAIDKGGLGRTAETELVFTPPVAGSLRWTGAS